MNGPYLFRVESPSSEDALCWGFHWNCPRYSWILKLSQCIFAIWFSSPLRKGCGPSLEQNCIHFISAPFMRACFVPSLGDISLVVLEKQIFKFRKCVYAIWLLSPLGKERGLSFEPTWYKQTYTFHFFAISPFYATFDVTWHDFIMMHYKIFAVLLKHSVWQLTFK